MNKPDPRARPPAPGGAAAPERDDTELLFADDASTAMRQPSAPKPAPPPSAPAQPAAPAAGARPPAPPPGRRPPPPGKAKSTRRRPTHASSGRRPPPPPPSSSGNAPKPSSGRAGRPPRPPAPPPTPGPAAAAAPPAPPPTPNPQAAPASPPAPKPARATAPPRRPKGFEIRRGQYFDGPDEEEELTPLGEISLPRSLIEEEEEKEFRKRFKKGEEDDIVDIYAQERHAAVTVRPSELEQEEDKRGSVNIVSLIALFIVVCGLLTATVYIFREPLRPHFDRLGITLPK